MKFNHFKLENIGEYAGFKDFIKEFMKRNRLRWIDGGAFSEVYSTDARTPRYVYKICDEFDLNSIDGYMVYLKNVVLENQNNPFVPKIYGINTYEYVNEWGDICYRAIIKMEWLQSYRCLTKHARREILNQKYGIDIGGTDYFGDDRWISNMHDSVVNSKRILKNFGNVSTPSLLYILTEINRNIRRYKSIHADIHDGNIMWRRRGQNHELVIVDPIS